MCYRYLKSAQALYPAWEDNITNNSVSGRFQFSQRDKTGKTRTLFASGITPKGNINLLEDLLTGKVIGIEESADSSAILKEINKNANIAGYDTELYFCPMFPNSKAEHLVIKELEFSFTTVNDFHSHNAEEVIEATKKQTIPPDAGFMIDKACNYLKNAREFHNEIEKIYISAMDFSKMDETYDMLKNEIL